MFRHFSTHHMNNPSATALKNMRRSPYQTLAAVMVLTITFFVGNLFFLLLTGSELVLRHFETQPQITAFFSVNSEAELVSQAEGAMQSKSYVKDVKVISKDQALEIYQQDNADDPLLLQLVSADILPASLEVSAHEIGSLVKIEQDLKGLAGVEEVVYQKDVVESLASWTSTLRMVGAGMVGLLLLTSVLVIMVITGMKVAARRQAIRVMQLIGASGWFIKAPFVFEGIYYGILASILAWSTTTLGLLYMTPWLTDFLGAIPLMPLPLPFLAVQLGVSIFIGLLLGGISSYLATSRFLRNR